MGHLAVISLTRSFQNAYFPETKYAHTKMTAKCPMSLDIEKLSRVYSCDHFDHYLAYIAPSHEKLQQCQFWTNLHTSKITSFRFGPAVRCIYNRSAWKVFNLFRLDVRIKKNHTWWWCTHHRNELQRFEVNKKRSCFEKCISSKPTFLDSISQLDVHTSHWHEKFMTVSSLMWGSRKHIHVDGVLIIATNYSSSQ